MGAVGKEWWDVKEKIESHTQDKTGHCGQRSSEHGALVLWLAFGRALARLRQENAGCFEELRGGRGPQINHRLKAWEGATGGGNYLSAEPAVTPLQMEERSHEGLSSQGSWLGQTPDERLNDLLHASAELCGFFFVDPSGLWGFSGQALAHIFGLKNLLPRHIRDTHGRWIIATPPQLK